MKNAENWTYILIYVVSKYKSNYGRSVIIGSQKTQIYQQFAGSWQEVFILLKKLSMPKSL